MHSMQRACVRPVQKACMHSVQRACVRSVQKACMHSIQKACVHYVQKACVHSIQKACVRSVQKACVHSLKVTMAIGQFAAHLRASASSKELSIFNADCFGVFVQRHYAECLMFSIPHLWMSTSSKVLSNFDAKRFCAHFMGSRYGYQPLRAMLHTCGCRPPPKCCPLSMQYAFVCTHGESLQ